MKTSTNTIRILAGLSFLIFFCPFFQTCADSSIIKNNHKAEVYDEKREDDKAYQDSLSKAADVNDQRLKKGDFTEEEKAYLKKERKEWTFSAYEISWTMNSEIFSKFKWEDFKENGFYGSLILPIVILLSLVLLIISFYNKFRLIFKLAISILLLTLILPMLLYTDTGDFEFLEMLRYGYYLFILNTIAIAVLSYKARQKQIPHAL